MNLKTILFLFVCSISFFTSYARTGAQTPTPKDGIYYFYSREYDAFLGRGSTWGTRATLDPYGSPILLERIGTSTHYHLQYVDDKYNRYLGAEVGLPWTDKTSVFPIEWAFILRYPCVGLMCVENYDGDNDFPGGFLTCDGVYNGCSFDQEQANACLFELVTLEEYNEIIANRRSLKDETNGCKPVDMTSKITNPTMHNGINGWNADFYYNIFTIRSNLTEVYQDMGTFSQTIKGLKKGVYKFSLMGFYRGTSRLICSEYDDLGYTLGNAYIFANDEQARFASWASGRTSNSYPNTMEEAYTLISQGKYVTEVYGRVGDDGILTIGIGLPQWNDDSWLIWSDATLTYYEKTPEPIVDSRNYALVIKFKDGGTLSYYLADKPEITFSSDVLNVKSDYVTMSSYKRSSIEDFHFVEITSDIDDVQQDEVRIVYNDNNNVRIYGVGSESVRVSVYDSGARLVPAEVVTTGECITVSLANLSKGVYIVSLGNNKSIKVLKK